MTDSEDEKNGDMPLMNIDEDPVMAYTESVTAVPLSLQ